MSIKCSWCGRWMHKETPVGLISHGCCKSCLKDLEKQIDADEEGVVKPSLTH